MRFIIGDYVIYEEKDVYGEIIKGKIVGIANNITDMINTCLVKLDSGTCIHFTSDNLK